jgi:hypothetical protein
MLATLDASSGFFSGSCGDFAAASAASSKQTGNSHANEAKPFDSRERLLIDILNPALEMIASGQIIRRRGSLWQGREGVNGQCFRRVEYDVIFRRVGV